MGNLGNLYLYYYYYYCNPSQKNNQTFYILQFHISIASNTRLGTGPFLQKFWLTATTCRSLFKSGKHDMFLKQLQYKTGHT